MANSAWSILVGVELDTSTAKLKRQLDKAAKGLNVPIDTKDAKKGLDDLSNSAEDVSLTFQAANLIFNRSVDIISSMVGEVYALNSALIEFQKVSDLSGESLDRYVDSLAEMGQAVARTGKPWCLSRGDGMANQHREQFKIQ